MIIDSHCHLWRFREDEYPWIGPHERSLRRDWLPRDLRVRCTAAGIDGVVAVQARQSLVETEWLLTLARGEPAILGVVGWVPLADPELGARLDALASPALVGARHVVQGEADPDFLARPAVARGLEALADRGLAYDLLVLAGQLPQAIRCADAHPRLRCVLDHGAKPLLRPAPAARAAFGGWAAGIRELARRPNAWCKLSGLLTEAGPGWSATGLRPWLDVLLEAFGPGRLLFGSDWPVCLATAEGEAWLELVRDLLAPLSATERALVMGGTARAVYRLPATDTRMPTGMHDRFQEQP